MYKNKAFLITIITFLSILPVISQNNTNSPYTSLGYGELSDNNSGEQRAMGGVAIGSRSKYRINSVNPASYSAADSVTFMFDVGVSALGSRFKDDLGQKKSTFNANLDYITLQFRLFKGVGLSAGLQPYSFAGYDYTLTDSTFTELQTNEMDTLVSSKAYYGSGGFSQFYVGLSVDLFKHLSLGANVYYMFGDYSNRKALAFNKSNHPTIYEYTNINANTFRFRLGAQFYNTFADKHDVTLGVIYEPKMSLNGDSRKIYQENNTIIDTTYLSNGFDIPQIFGAGLFYTYDEKLSIGFDYSLQQWKDAKYYGATNALSNRTKLALGVEYQPNFRSRKFFQRTMYRAGLNMTDPYYKLDDKEAGKNFGITFGVGLPLSNSSRTMLNFAFEYGKVNSFEQLKEDYFKLTFNFAFTETWFFKRKL